MVYLIFFAWPLSVCSLIFMSQQLCRVIDVFQRSLGDSCQTALIGGFDEPEYVPGGPGKMAQIRFRADYLSSALHEVAHWCIAGAARRKLYDFGYWYDTEGRSSEQQLRFERFEVKPQALEWIFAVACNHPFHLSRDNFGVDYISSFDFADAVSSQAGRWCLKMPLRAARFADSLALEFDIKDHLNQKNYAREALC